MVEGPFDDDEFLPPVRQGGGVRRLGIAAAACLLLVGGMAVVGMPQRTARHGGRVVRDVVSFQLPAADGTSVGQLLAPELTPRTSSHHNRHRATPAPDLISGTVTVAEPPVVTLTTTSVVTQSSEQRSSGGSTDGPASSGRTSQSSDDTTSGIQPNDNTTSTTEPTKLHGKGWGPGGKGHGGADVQAKTAGRGQGSSH